MQGRARVLILVALIIVVVAIVAVFLLNSTETTPTNNNNQNQNTSQTDEAPDATREPTPTPFPTVELEEVVVAIQNISRGSEIPPNAIRLQLYPRDAIPFSAIGSTEDVIGKIARTDIFREEIILDSKIVDGLGDIGDVGSDAAAIIPNGLRLVALPMDRITSVAYAIQPGDRVDIIVSLLYIDIDEDFQTRLPNSVFIISPVEDEQGNVVLGIGEELTGRFESETIPIQTGDQIFQRTYPILVSPSEGAGPRPRLVTQRTIQDALVLHVGNFPNDGRLFEAVPTPTPVIVEEEQQPQNAQTAPPPTQPPPRPDIVALAVTPQESVILTWLVEAGVPITFTLRSAADTSRVPTDPVTLDYIMNEYTITVPAKRGFSIEPAIRSIRQLDLADRISISGSGD